MGKEGGGGQQIEIPILVTVPHFLQCLRAMEKFPSLLIPSKISIFPEELFFLLKQALLKLSSLLFLKFVGSTATCKPSLLGRFVAYLNLISLF